MGKFDNIIEEINVKLPDNNKQKIHAVDVRDVLTDLTEAIETVQDEQAAQTEADIVQKIGAVTETIDELNDTINDTIDSLAESTSQQISAVDAKVDELASDPEISTSDRPGELFIADKYDNILFQITGGHIQTQTFNSADTVRNNTLKLLMISNSYGLDAIAYVPFILNEIAPQIKYHICCVFYSGCSLQQHWQFINNNSASYTYYYIMNGMKSWATSPDNKQTWSSLWSRDDWNIVTLQQKSTESPIWSTYQPYLNNILNKLYSSKKNLKLGWILTQASADGGTRFPDASLDPQGKYQTSATMFEGQIECAKNVLNTTPISFVIPTGTAIQNARNNQTLDSLGTFGHLTYDGYHLQEGLPSQIAAYTMTLSLLDQLHINQGIFGNGIRPTAAWLADKSIPGAQGTSVGVTDANVQSAQKCAILANTHPLEVLTGIV